MLRFAQKKRAALRMFLAFKGLPFNALPLLGGTAVKNPPANAGDSGDVGSIMGHEDPLKSTHSSILAGITP